MLGKDIANDKLFNSFRKSNILKEIEDFLSSSKRRLEKELSVLPREKIKQWGKYIHGDKYDYNRLYIDRTFVSVYCNDCGNTVSAPFSVHFSRNYKCPSCKKNTKTINDEEKELKRKGKKDVFLAKAKALYGNRFDYSAIDYRGTSSVITIICKEHGPFRTKAYNHLRGAICPECDKKAMEEIKVLDYEDVMNKINTLFKGKYKIVKANKNLSPRSSLVLECKEHGLFPRKIYKLLQGFGCKDCEMDYKNIRNDAFILRLKDIYGDDLDYSRVMLMDRSTPITLGCKKHGWFETYSYKALKGGIICPQCKKNH